MERQLNDKLRIRNEELQDLLEDALTQIQEMREEFTSALDDIEDLLTNI